MRWRRYINLIALIGVLVHAGLLVRHHHAMLGAHLDRQALIGALSVICHGSGQTSAPGEAELPWVPLPSDNQSSQCPLCAGLSAAFAISASADHGVPLQFQAAAPQVPQYAAPRFEVTRLRPPTRAPPQFA